MYIGSGNLWDLKGSFIVLITSSFLKSSKLIQRNGARGSRPFTHLSWVNHATIRSSIPHTNEPLRDVYFRAIPKHSKHRRGFFPKPRVRNNRRVNEGFGATFVLGVTANGRNTVGF